MANSKNQNFLHGAAILTVTVAIVKVLGAVYKIPLYNLLGDEGSAYFGVAYNIYSLLLTFSTAGLPVALSRMISESNALGRRMQIKRTFRVAWLSFFVLGMAGTLIMLLFPDKLSVIMEQAGAEASISALAPAVVMVCIMSAYRGYTQGLSNMIPTSVSQIIEVVCKLVFGLGLAWWFSKSGLGLQMASAGAILGVTIGSALALLYIVIYKLKSDKEVLLPMANPDVPLSSYQTFKRLLMIGIPVTLGSALLNIIALIDTKLIMNRLQFAAGFSYDEATVLYGIYFKVQTLFNLPSSFIVPLTISIIPAIAAAIAKNRKAEARKITEASLKITTLLALPAGVGLSVLSYDIVNVIYPNSSSEGPLLLAVLGIASYFVCLTLITNAILQAYGHERLPVYTMPIGGLVKLASTWLLVSLPAIGVHGASIGTLVCYAVISVFNIVFILIKVPERPSLRSVFTKPILATLLMAVSAYGVRALVYPIAVNVFSSEWVAMAVSMTIAILAACVVYAVAIIVTKAISKEELELLPKGEKIAKMLKIS